MVVSYALGVFNDNFFRQAAMLLAVTAGRKDLQGTLILLFTLPYLLFSAAAGWLADRFAKRDVVIAAKGLEVAAMVAGAAGLLTGSWWLIAAMVFTMGLQSCMFGPSLNGSIPELYPAAYVTKANGVLKVFMTGGILTGFALAGVTLDLGRAGDRGDAGGRLAVACVALAVAAVGLAAALAVPRRPPADRKAGFPWTFSFRSLGELRRIASDRLLLTTVFADAFAWFIGSLFIPLTNVMGKRQLGLSDTATSGLLAAELLGVAGGGLLSTKLAVGPRWYRVLIPAAGCLGAAMLLVPAAAWLPGGAAYACLLALFLAAGAAGGMFMIPCESFIQVRPDPRRKGAVIAASNFVIFAGIMVSGPLANLLTDLLAGSWCFAVAGVGALGVGAALWAALPHGSDAC